MKITGVCSPRGYSSPRIRIKGITDLEQRIGVDLVAWRIGEGPINLRQVRIWLRNATPDDIDRAKACCLPHSVVTIDASRRIVAENEGPLAKAGSRRWEMVDGFSASEADDVELASIAQVMAAQAARQRRDLVIVDDTVTAASFYAGSLDETAEDNTAEANRTKIKAAEDRLGVVLPDLLRQLYEFRDGGSVDNICIPRSGVADHSDYKQISEPFSGYSKLLPLDRIRTVYDAFLDFADPDDESYESYFRNGVEKMVVLVQYYVEILFLDYRQAGAVGVGFVDFDSDRWPDEIVSWKNFDDFFNELRHYEDV